MPRQQRGADHEEAAGLEFKVASEFHAWVTFETWSGVPVSGTRTFWSRVLRPISMRASPRIPGRGSTTCPAGPACRIPVAGKRRAPRAVNCSRADAVESCGRRAIALIRVGAVTQAHFLAGFQPRERRFGNRQPHDRVGPFPRLEHEGAPRPFPAVERCRQTRFPRQTRPETARLSSSRPAPAHPRARSSAWVSRASVGCARGLMLNCELLAAEMVVQTPQLDEFLV